MKNSTWKIEYECPQCGAPSVMDEDQNVLSCDYCRVRHIHLSHGRDVLFIPPRAASGEEVVFAPYWRFTGTAFTLEPQSVSSRIVDASSRAVPLNTIPYSLGLRPQVQHLKPVTPQHPGRFLPPAVSLEEMVQGVKKRSFVTPEPENAEAPDSAHHGLLSVLLHTKTDEGGGENNLLTDALSALSGTRHNSGGTETVFLGQAASLIYSPLALRGDTILDGLTGSVLGAISTGQRPVFATAKTGAGTPLRFLAAICPNCGGDLEGHANSTVFTCGNCVSVWRRSVSGLKRTPCAVVRRSTRDTVYLPFWRIRPKVAGLRLETNSDLAVLANIPRLPRQAWGERQAYLTVPAFRLSPQLFARFARRAGFLEDEPEPLTGFDTLRLYPAELPVTAVLPWLKALVYDLARPKHAIFPRLHEIAVTPVTASLLYLPFETTGNELIERSLSMRVGVNGLLRSFFSPSAP